MNRKEAEAMGAAAEVLSPVFEKTSASIDKEYGEKELPKLSTNEWLQLRRLCSGETPRGWRSGWSMARRSLESHGLVDGHGWPTRWGVVANRRRVTGKP